MSDKLEHIRRALAQEGLFIADPTRTRPWREVREELMRRSRETPPRKRFADSARARARKAYNHHRWVRSVTTLLEDWVANRPEFIEVFDDHVKPSGWLDVSVLLPDGKSFWLFSVLPEEAPEEYEFGINDIDFYENDPGREFTDEDVLLFMRKLLERLAPEIAGIDIRIISSERFSSLIFG